MIWSLIRCPCCNTTPSFLIPERNPMTPLEEKLNQLNLSTMSRQLETTLTEAAAKNPRGGATLGWPRRKEMEARKQPPHRPPLKFFTSAGAPQHRRLSLSSSQAPPAG